MGLALILEIVAVEGERMGVTAQIGLKPLSTLDVGVGSILPRSQSGRSGMTRRSRPQRHRMASLVFVVTLRSCCV